MPICSDPFVFQQPCWKYRYLPDVMTSAYRRAATFIDWFIRSDYMDYRQFGSSSDMWIQDAKRAQRCWDAAEFGCDGSTHGEHIQDLRNAFKEWLRDHKSEGEHARFEDAVTMYLDELESWHEMHGTLDQQVN